MSDRIRKLPFFKYLGVMIGVFVFRLLILTLRVRATPRAKALLGGTPRATLLLLWHNRLALALVTAQKKFRRLNLTALVSASHDGAALALIMKSFRIRTARGSSSRRAVEATRELISALAQGRNVAITPDGPRGPVYQVKAGTAELAASHTSSVYIVGLKASRFWQLRSWDKFIVPKPFATVTIDVEKVEAEISKEKIQEALIKLNS
jgi:lysophospholipid acyltransferase (LPLAT)-like uncharacterized protein